MQVNSLFTVCVNTNVIVCFSLITSAFQQESTAPEHNFQSVTTETFGEFMSSCVACNCRHCSTRVPAHVICLFYGVYVFCVGNLVGSWFLSFLLCESFLASML